MLPLMFTTLIFSTPPLMAQSLIAHSLSALPVSKNEAPLIPEAVPLEEPGRYASPRNYDDTIKYYQRYFRSAGGVRWHHIVNLPSVKAKHIKSLNESTSWEGINIYETQGHVRFYVIPRKKPAPSP